MQEKPISDLLLLFLFLNCGGFIILFFFYTGRYLKRTFYWLITVNISFSIFLMLNRLLVSRGYHIDDEIAYWIIILPLIGLGYILERVFVRKIQPNNDTATISDRLSMQKDEVYSLPITQEAKVKWYYHLMFGFFEVLFLAAILLPDKNDPERGLLVTIGVILFVFFGYMWLGQGFLKKPFLKVTSDYLEYKWLFGHKLLYWEQIQHMEFINIKGVNFLGIADNPRSRSFWETTNRMLGDNYTIRIPLGMFPDIDFEKLYSTIMEKTRQS